MTEFSLAQFKFLLRFVQQRVFYGILMNILAEITSIMFGHHTFYPV